MTDTQVISFRAHKNLKSWLTSAGRGFLGGSPELLRLILTRTVYEQANISGLGSLLGRLGKDNRQPSIGSTAVYAARLPQSNADLIKDAAASRHQGVSEWCASALFQWYLSFKAYQESHVNDDADWLVEYGHLYRAKVDEIGRVYAQKAVRQFN